MRFGCRPGTVLGIWSVRLLISSLVFFIVFFLIVASGQRGGDAIFSNLSLAIPMLVAVSSATGAFFTGILSIMKNEERAVLVFVSTVLGFFVLLFVLAEIFFPHQDVS